MILSCGSKTFLVGEYVALMGGPCLLATTAPRFKLEVKNGTGINPFHPESPAGLLWKKTALTQKLDAQFLKTHAGGGFGASSAEFLLLSSAIQALQAKASEAQLEADLFAMLNEYAEVNRGRVPLPSGADVIAQARGSVTLFEKTQGRIETSAWGFANLGFLLVSTGNKLATHEHLAQLDLQNLDLETLTELTRQAIQAHRIHHELNFIETIRKIRKQLKSQGLEAEKTTQMIDELERAPSIRAIKGCGALGADVLLLLVENKDLLRIRELVSKKYQVIASHQDLTEGILVESTNI